MAHVDNTVWLRQHMTRGTGLAHVLLYTPTARSPAMGIVRACSFKRLFTTPPEAG